MTQLYIASIALAASIAATLWFWRFRRINIGPLLCKVITAGTVAGRLTFVLTRLDIYMHSPLSMLDLRDGGFVGVGAMFAAFATATEGSRRSAVLRKPLAIALGSGACAWALATFLIPYFAGSPMRVPATLVRNLDGDAVNLATFRGKPLVINLWATWCPPCRREMPLLDDAQRTHANVQFVFVNQAEDLPEIQRFLHTQRLALHNVFSDRLHQVGSATNSSAMPTTLFFNRQGELVDRHVGEIDAKSLDAKLEPLKRRISPTD